MSKKNKNNHANINVAGVKSVNISKSLLIDATFRRSYEELRAIQTTKWEDYGEDLAVTALQCGSKYAKGSLIVYGRCTNGAEDWDCENFKDLHWLRSAFERSYPSSGEYNPKKSSFLRTSKSIGEHLFAEDWWRYICLSNLCKLAPTDQGNCSDKIYYQTLSQNSTIFKRELELLTPRHAVLLTGFDWAKDFIYALDNKHQDPSSIFWLGNNRFIYNYIWNGIHIIVSDHPQGKNSKLLSEAIIYSMHYHNI